MSLQNNQIGLPLLRFTKSPDKLRVYVRKYEPGSSRPNSEAKKRSLHPADAIAVFNVETDKSIPVWLSYTKIEGFGELEIVCNEYPRIMVGYIDHILYLYGSKNGYDLPDLEKVGYKEVQLKFRPLNLGCHTIGLKGVYLKVNRALCVSISSHFHLNEGVSNDRAALIESFSLDKSGKSNVGSYVD